MKKRRQYKYKVVRRIDDESCIIGSSLDDSLYTLVYTKGCIVKAQKRTLGIMVFQTRKLAKFFINRFSKYTRKQWIIKRVIPIGRGKVPPYISSSTAYHSLNRFYGEAGAHSIVPPDGTICYPAVEVID